MCLHLMSLLLFVLTRNILLILSIFFTSYYIHMELEFLSRECPSILRAHSFYVNVLKGVLQLVFCDMSEVIKAQPDFILQNF